MNLATLIVVENLHKKASLEQSEKLIQRTRKPPTSKSKNRRVVSSRQVTFLSQNILMFLHIPVQGQLFLL